MKIEKKCQHVKVKPLFTFENILGKSSVRNSAIVSGDVILKNFGLLVFNIF